MSSSERTQGRPVLVAFQRFGPYHRARLAAADSVLPAVGLELGTIDDYAWTYDTSEVPAKLVTLFKGQDPDRVAPRLLLSRLSGILDELRPAAVAVPGWSQRCALAVLAACRERAVPVLLMSESTSEDGHRFAFSEYVKRQVVAGFSAALVGGVEPKGYVRKLGMPRERVFLGYDVVDNAHFQHGAEAARADRDVTRRRIATPSRFFLASSRFIKKKNLFRLLDAYLRYRVLAGEGAWKLVVLGDGELRPRLEAHRRALGLEEHVQMPGFKQYDDLPAWYALASAFVHASVVEPWGLVVNEAMAAGLPVLVSERCGCAPDLVRDGINGFTFDPYDVEGLARLMHHMAHGAIDREAMSRQSQEVIKDWGPERFAEGLMKAVDVALSTPVPRASWFERLLLRALMCR